MRFAYALAFSTIVTVIAGAFLAPPTLAAAPQATPAYREGVHYHLLPEPVDVQRPTQIEVVEVFWYGCSHCFHFEPVVLEWSKNLAEDVYFQQLPAMWNRLMETHARAFYAAEKLGIRDEVHQAIYDRLHVDIRSLDTAEAVADLFAEHGADKEEAVRIFNSADATTFLKLADRKARAYQISGTPQLIVHGRYRVEASQRVPQQDMFKVVDFLINKIRQERKEDQSN